MKEKEEYLTWYNQVTKSPFSLEDWEDYRANLVYLEYVQDCKNGDIHELRGIITKTGNPVTL